MSDHHKIIGAKGGRAKVKKGFAMLSRDQLKEIAARGGRVTKNDRENMRDLPQENQSKTSS